MNKPPRPHSPPAVDRRKAERRVHDGEPPGRHDRRRGVEARQPEVVEIEMSNSEWTALTDLPLTPRKP